jgi:hypothetical protein
MKTSHILLTVAVATAAPAYLALAAEENRIKNAMQKAHKAPKTEEKLSDKIIAGTATPEEKQIAFALYKGMAEAEAPKGDDAAFKVKVGKLITATSHVIEGREGAIEAYKTAVNCKACHDDHRPD